MLDPHRVPIDEPVFSPWKESRLEAWAAFGGTLAAIHICACNLLSWYEKCQMAARDKMSMIITCFWVKSRFEYVWARCLDRKFKILFSVDFAFEKYMVVASTDSWLFPFWTILDAHSFNVMIISCELYLFHLRRLWSAARGLMIRSRRICLSSTPFDDPIRSKRFDNLQHAAQVSLWSKDPPRKSRCAVFGLFATTRYSRVVSVWSDADRKMSHSYCQLFTLVGVTLSCMFEFRCILVNVHLQ